MKVDRKFEDQIARSFEKGEWKPVKNLKKEMERFREAATVNVTEKSAGKHPHISDGSRRASGKGRSGRVAISDTDGKRASQVCVWPPCGGVGTYNITFRRTRD